MKISEKSIQNLILQYLNLKGIFCFPIKRSGVYDPTKNIFRKPNGAWDINGIFDIAGMLPDGKGLWIEVKTPKTKNNLSPDQKKFLKKGLDNNQIIFVAWSIEQVEENLKDYLN
jgi:hypothetical protein